jgi:hypothetical protein
MAGKRSAKEVLDEWQQKMKAKSDEATQAVGGGVISAAQTVPGLAKDAAMIATTPQRMSLAVGQGIYSGGKEALQDAQLIDRDRGWYMNKAGDILDSTGQVIKSAAGGIAQDLSGAAQSAGQGLSDIYSMAQQKMQGAVPAPSAYDQEMQGMDMTSTPETKAYYDKMLADSQVPMAQKAGQAVGGLLDSAGGAYDKMKGMGGQFMQGLQGNQPPAAPAGIDPAQIQQLLQSLSPEEKAALMQQLGGGQ